MLTWFVDIRFYFWVAMSEFLDSEAQVEGDTSDVDSICCHETSEKELEIEIDDFEDSNKKINAILCNKIW